MKHFLLISVAVLLSAQIASADGYPEAFSDAVHFYSHGNFNKARELFVACQSSDDFDPVNLSIWIGRCDTGLQEQRRNAQAAERRRQAKRAQRIQNKYVYISVNAAESGDLFETTKSAMSEVLRQNGRSFCPSLDDALTIVTVCLNIKQEGGSNGFYKASGEGFVRLGSAIDEKEFVGQWTVDGEATSAASMDDAVRLLRNKLNHKLGYALDNLLNGRPQSPEYYIPEQSISIFIPKSRNIGEEDLIVMREALNGYIARTPGMTVSDALSKDKLDDFDVIGKLQAQYVKREGRAPVHELDGFKLILRLSVREEANKDYTFIGEIMELGTGKSLTTATIHGSDFGITDLSPRNQELAAKALAVGLGFCNWEIGEYIGKHKLAYYDGLHGLLVQEYAPFTISGWKNIRRTTNPFREIGMVRGCIIADDRGIINPGEAYQWRYPTLAELKKVREGIDGQGGRRELGLAGSYWSSSSDTKGTHFVLDFISGEEKKCKDNDFKVASWLLVKEF